MIICPATVIHFIASQRPDTGILERAMETDIKVTPLPDSKKTRALLVKYDSGEQVDDDGSSIVRLFVKQPLDLFNRLSRMLIIREGFFYESAHSIDALQKFLPNTKYFSINTFYSILLRSWIKEVERFGDVVSTNEAKLQYLPHVGFVLRTFHAALNRGQLESKNIEEYAKLRSLTGGRPSSFLSLGLVDDEFLKLNNLPLYNFINNHYLKDAVAKIKKANEQWDTSTLIHSDLNETNILVYRDRQRNQNRAHIIDWEFVVWGDLAWDIATIIYHLIVKNLKLADITEANIRPLFSSFWNGENGYHQTNIDALKPFFGPALFDKIMVFVGIKFYDDLLDGSAKNQAGGLKLTTDSSQNQAEDSGQSTNAEIEMTLIAENFILEKYTKFFF